MITASVQTAQDAAPLTFGVVLVMVAAMVLLVGCVMVSAAAVEGLRRRARRVVDLDRERSKRRHPASNVTRLHRQNNVRVLPRGRAG